MLGVPQVMMMSMLTPLRELLALIIRWKSVPYALHRPVYCSGRVRASARAAIILFSGSVRHRCVAMMGPGGSPPFLWYLSSWELASLSHFQCVIDMSGVESQQLLYSQWN